MVKLLSQAAAAYVQAINSHAAAEFAALFADNAVVDDAGRVFRGIEAIKAWSDHEIMNALVTLEVLDVADRGGNVIMTTKVDGNFDKTGLPNPLIMEHELSVENDKIIGLNCRLAGDRPSR
jgi:ketosteroid isomerase-like protein